MKQAVSITATGSYTPTQIIPNQALVERFNLTVDDEWIFNKTGIRSRHWLQPDETTSDMAVIAAQRCLAQAGVRPDQLDRLIVATISPDLPSPSTATIVARKLGARCMAFDVSAACSGFLYGLEMAAGAIQMGARRVLVIGADARSRYVNPKDHRSTVLFADGAGCALVERSAKPGFLSLVCGAEGLERMGAYVPAGGAQRPASAETVAQGLHYLHIEPKTDIFDLFLKFTLESCQQAMDQAGVTVKDIDTFITHQGNGHLVQMAAKALGFPPEAVVDEVIHHGNTAGASVAIALDETLRKGRIRPGSKALLAAVGAGVTFAASVYQF